MIRGPSWGPTRKQGLLLLVFLLVIAAAVLLFARRASAAPDAGAKVCNSAEACEFFSQVLECERQLDVALREKRGEVEKVASATVTCSLTCASCPLCECGGTVWGYMGAVGGGVALGALVCGLASDAGGVTVVR